MVTQAGNPGNRDDILESERRLNQRVADEDRRRREIEAANRQRQAARADAEQNRLSIQQGQGRQQLSDQQAEVERQRVIEVANELLEFQERVADRRRERDARASRPRLITL